MPVHGIADSELSRQSTTRTYTSIYQQYESNADLQGLSIQAALARRLAEFASSANRKPTLITATRNANPARPTELQKC